MRAPHHTLWTLLLTFYLPTPSISFTVAPRVQHHPQLSTSHRKSFSPRTRQSTALQYGESRGVDSQLLFDTWEWTANLGAPAALVAGAVLATMVESREQLSPKNSDKAYVRRLKKATRLLFLSSFGLEIISIFVTTVTGTMLLGHGDTAGLLKNLDFNSPMGFLENNFEFEFLTSRICFHQGLFHWLAGLSLELLIPKKGEGVAARRMNMFTSSALFTIMVAMLSFLNRHMTFYNNYAGMLRRYAVVTFRMYFLPLQPLTIVMLPMGIGTAILGWRAFKSSGEEEQLDEDSFNEESGY